MEKAHPSFPEPETSTEPSFSTFDRALEEYLAGLPKDKKKFKFIELCRASGTNATPQAINALLQHKEARHSLSGPVHRIFSRVMSALRDYSDVIGQLVSAQPLPCAIIWGALKVVVEASNRCDSMFESIQKELLSLAEYLQRITVYEDLYGDSKEMQRLFFVSYTNIIHFWHRVHKECKRKGLAITARALTSSSLNKMNSIISQIHSISNNICEQASLCQGQKDKQEYSETRTERKLQSEHREKQDVANHFDVCKMIRDHLTPPDDVARPNSHRHESNLRYLQPETCQWLTEESRYITWSGPRSDSAHRLFCLSGLQGHGKSILTSFAIRDLESKGAAVAYYFCQFSQPCEDPTQILRLLGLQLFNIYFERRLNLDQEFGQRILQSRKPEHIQDIINELVLRLLYGGGVYFFIDGLDEAVPNGISPVLVFLNDLRKKWVTYEVCVWVTKRRQVRPVECFEKHIQPELRLTLELADHTEADVVRFLRAKLQDLKQRFHSQQSDLSEKESALFRTAESYLLARAQGNFLWARLMTKDFDGENRVEDVKELLEHVLHDTPKELVDLYKSYFDRFGRSHRDNETRRVAIKVMSLVAFARRQLRLEELQMAAAILAGHGKKQKAASDATRLINTMPLKTFLAKYTILVEVDGNASAPAPTDACRLVHSSVLEFLDQNPATLDNAPKDHQLQISRFALANACLIYLARPVYSQLLQKQSLSDGTYTWVDSDGATVDKQVFSQYASKYWVRHLEDLDKKEQDQIRGRVVAFVSSHNFQTCMQIQSIWVQGRFDVYYVGDQLSLLRAVPEWLHRSRRSSESKHLTDGTKCWSDYRELMYTWRTLLSCGGCHDSNADCSYLTFRGELDRIWWTTLGPDHLFCNFQSRYISFRLAIGKNPSSECFEALSVSKEQIVIVRLMNKNSSEGSLQFICEHWTLSDHVSAPTLSKKQVITTTEAATTWLLYAKPPSEGLAHLVAKPCALSSDAQILRLGSQLFRKDKDNEYRVASGGGAPAYFEEVSGRGALVVIGSRSHTLAAQLQEPHRLVETFGKDFTRLERLANPSDTMGDTSSSDESDDDSWLSEASSDSSAVEMEAYESWSEGSTDNEGYVSSSGSEVSGLPTSDLGSDAEPEDNSTSSSSSDEADPVGGSESASGEGTPSELSQYAFPIGGFNQDSDSEEELWGMEVDARLGVLLNDMRSSNTREPTVLLTVLQYNDNSTPTKLFEYSCPLRFMLYDSPPAVHPQESLVVWPLGGSDLLFADVAGKTYFTRQLRPSAPHTRQISVKLQFSSCGHFLHVASLEVHVKEVEGDRRCKNRHCLVHHPLPDIQLYILVLTYRLSSRKPTRSPPALLHRVKVVLGKHEGLLSVSQLPFMFTWTPRDLFVSRRGTYLEVFRIQLFSKRTGEGCPPEQIQGDVLVPMKKILLPDTAALRDVYFVPLSDDGNGASMVIVGSETRMRAVLMEDFAELPEGVLDAIDSETSDLQKRRTLAPSVGAILQAEDMGGWVQAEGVLVPQGRSMGYLDMRKEKFDPVDDCDAEPY